MTVSSVRAATGAFRSGISATATTTAETGATRRWNSAVSIVVHTSQTKQLCEGTDKVASSIFLRVLTVLHLMTSGQGRFQGGGAGEQHPQ